MKKIWLIRHASSRYNDSGRIQGQKDIELSDSGLEEAAKLAEDFDLSFDSIYSSELKRARQTAEALIQDTDHKLRRREELNERALGVLEGRGCSSWKDIDLEGGPDWKPQGGESLREHSDRVSNFLAELKDDEAEGIVVLAHSGTIRAIIAEINGLDSKELWDMSVDNCGVTGLEYSEKQGWDISYVNQDASEI